MCITIIALFYEILYAMSVIIVYINITIICICVKFSCFVAICGSFIRICLRFDCVLCEFVGDAFVRREGECTNFLSIVFVEVVSLGVVWFRGRFER